MHWLGYLVTATVVATAALLARRRPLAALAVLLGCAVAETTTPRLWRTAVLHPVVQILPSQPVLLVLLIGIVVGLIAVTRTSPVSAGSAMVAAATLAGCTASRTQVAAGMGLDLSPEVTVVLAVAIGWLIGHSVRQSRLHSEALHTQDQAQAVTSERLRIARELHDMVAHSIGIIAIQAGAGSRVIDTQPDQARQALAVIETTSRETLYGLRRMLGALRRTDQDAGQATDQATSQAGSHGTDLSPAPGLADLDRLARTTADAGVRVDVHWTGLRSPLPAHIDMSAFRIVQEAVTNVVRHADTERCEVRIDRRHRELRIEVTDEGSGCATPGAGYGIIGMRERVGLLHGQFAAGPQPGGGYRVAAHLPLPVRSDPGLTAVPAR